MPLKLNSPAGGSITLDVPSNLTTANTLTLPSIVANATYLTTGQSATINVGYSVTAFNAGANVATYGTWTPNPSNGNYQYANSNGAFTIAAPATDCAIEVLFSNGLGAAGNGAGSITFSGFKVQSGGTGDAYTTAANNQYILTIKRINGIPTYLWKALQ